MSDEIALLLLHGGKANAMTAELLDKIEQLVDDFERSPARAGVLTGYDKYFSAGLALPALIDLDRVTLRAFMDRFSRAMLRVFACEKPIVAAINGHAIAGGCVLALMCDVRVMVDDRDIVIGLNESQLGIGLPPVVLEPLRAQVSPEHLVDIAMRGELMTPALAEERKLVHAVAPRDTVMLVAETNARILSAVGERAVRQIKRALRAPVIDAISARHATETEAWLDTWFSDEAQQRLRAAVARIR